MFKDYLKKNGEENARNTTKRPKDKRTDQTKHKSVGCGRKDGKAEIKMGWPFGEDSRLTRKTTRWRSRTTNRNPGGPRMRWKDDIQKLEG